jgi:hypothetical protein
LRWPLIRDRQALSDSLPIVPLRTHVIERGFQVGQPGFRQRCTYVQFHVFARCALRRRIGVRNRRINSVQLAWLDMPLAVLVFGPEILPDLIARRIVVLFKPTALAAVVRVYT